MPNSLKALTNNTVMNSLIDDRWELVARYHKQHPFKNELKVIDRRLVPQNITSGAIIHPVLGFLLDVLLLSESP